MTKLGFKCNSLLVKYLCSKCICMLIKYLSCHCGCLSSKPSFTFSIWLYGLEGVSHNGLGGSGMDFQTQAGSHIVA